MIADTVIAAVTAYGRISPIALPITTDLWGQPSRSFFVSHVATHSAEEWPEPRSDGRLQHHPKQVIRTIAVDLKRDVPDTCPATWSQAHPPILRTARTSARADRWLSDGSTKSSCNGCGSLLG